MKLLEKFSSDQVKTFYETFEANMSNYETVNKQTVDQLYSLLDFDQFKKKMLMYKRGMDDKSLTKPSAEDESGVLPLKPLLDG